MTQPNTVRTASQGSCLAWPAGLSDTFFRQVFRANPESMSITRLDDGMFLDVSAGFERITGYTRAEALGKTAVELGLYDEIPGGRPAVYNRLCAQGIVRDLRTPLRTRSGEVRNLRVTFERIRLDGEDCSLTIAHDITEQVIAEEEVWQSEKLLRQIIDASPNSVFVKDRDGRYILANRAMAARNGLAPDDMVGMHDLDIGANWFQSEAAIEQFRQTERRVIDTGEPLFIPEEEFVFRDGQRAWFQTTKLPLAIKGNQECLLGIAVDITERKLIEEQVRESEVRYRLLFDAAGVGIGYWTPEGNLISFNHRALGYLVDQGTDFTGQPCTRIFPGDVGIKTLERIRYAASSRESRSYEDTVEFNGQSYWFLSTLTPILRPDGSVAGVQVISQDLTEQRRTQLELKMQKSLLEEAEKLANIGSWEWRPSNDMVYWSPQLYAIYGRDPQMGPPKSEQWWDYVHPDDLERVRIELNRVVNQGEIHDTTFRILRGREKDIRYIHSRGTVTRDTMGNVQTVMAITQDITKQVRDEENLRESEGKLRALADAAFDAVFLSDKGVCLDQNRTAESMFGYSRDEAVGRMVTDWVAPGHRDLVLHHALTGYEGRYEVTAVRKDGSILPCAVQACMLDYQGRRIRYTAVSDITERKRAEEELRRSRLFADNIVQTASVMIVGLDVHGRVTLFNPAGEQITGYTQEELLGKNWFRTLIPPGQRASMIKRFERLNRGGLMKVYEGPVLTKAGEERIITWSNNEIAVDGEIIGSISFGIDITDRRHTEEQLLQLNKRLAAEHEALLDKNIALKEYLDHMDEEKRDYKHQICDSIGKLLSPIVAELERTGGQLNPRKIAVVRDGLDAILRKDLDDFAGNVQKLSPREMDICQLIRKGLLSKEIAAELSISTQTVHKHRQLIRKKLQINNKGVNLSSFLRSRS